MMINAVTPNNAEPAPVRDTMMERVAKAIYGVAVKRAEDKASEYEIPLATISAAISEVIASPDRTAAIVIFALIDDLMISFLSKNLNPNLKGGLSTLFEGSGILSTAHDRITMSAALYWINKATYQDLNLLRGIRNRFAHDVSISTFADNAVRGYVSSMSRREDQFYRTEEVAQIFRPKDTLSLREIYLLRSIGAVDHLCMDFTHLPAARANHVNPTDMFKGGFDSVPESLQGLKREIASACIRIAGTAESLAQYAAEKEAN